MKQIQHFLYNVLHFSYTKLILRVKTELKSSRWAICIEIILNRFCKEKNSARDDRRDENQNGIPQLVNSFLVITKYAMAWLWVTMSDKLSLTINYNWKFSVA